VRAIRASLVVVILFNLALLAAYAPLRSMLTRYRIARQQTELRAAQLERRALYHQAALARRPDQVMSRAAALGIDVHRVEREEIDRASVTPPATKPLAMASRR